LLLVNPLRSASGVKSMPAADRAELNDKIMTKKSITPCGAKISPGNSKLGRIPNLSLIPGKDCGDVPCKRDCYALKAWRQYPEVKAAWSHNSHLAHSNREAFFADVESYLAKRMPRFFRWHVAGDILDQSYLGQMKRLARAYPATKFLAFTKRHDLAFVNLPENLAIVFSMWSGWGDVDHARKLGLPIAWMQDGAETRVPANVLECPGNCETCGMCWQLKKIGRDVVFHKH
jgi:hypothetical protein